MRSRWKPSRAQTQPASGQNPTTNHYEEETYGNCGCPIRLDIIAQFLNYAICISITYNLV